MSDERDPREEQRHRRDPGPTISRNVKAPALALWAVLADGWSYATWVVGASRVRDVDEGWPTPESRIHHSFGLWPATIEDTTRVVLAEEPTEMVLVARGWPVGEARVRLSIAPTGTETCTVTMTEDAIRGPGKLIPAPVRRVLIAPRNKESLHRLALLAEGRHRNRDDDAA
nr:SRPBCC family protein [Actinomycetales bacterium]